MISKLKDTHLFAGMSEAEIECCLSCGKAVVRAYPKDVLIFRQNEPPEKLMVLLDGSIVVGNDSSDGKRSVVASFNKPGELFGEVFLFLGKRAYDHYAQAVTACTVLQIPRDILYHTCGENCAYHAKLIANMLSILAHKAYFLNRRLQVLSCTTLRQKIAKLLLQNAAPDGRTVLSMNREELADFLGTVRPSLSRELLRMQEDGLIRLEKKDILIADSAGMRALL